MICWKRRSDLQKGAASGGIEPPLGRAIAGGVAGAAPGAGRGLRREYLEKGNSQARKRDAA
ncbi:hypothetical protein MASR2M74_16280 [Paracoccaceae bacterium]